MKIQLNEKNCKNLQTLNFNMVITRTQQISAKKIRLKHQQFF